MKKIILIPLILLTVFTLISFNINTTDGIVTHESSDKSYRWEGADYVTTVDVELNNTIMDELTKSPYYWFNTSLLDYSVSDNNYTVTLDFDVKPNSLTNLLTAPSLNSSKITNFNSVYSFMSEPLTEENLTVAMNDLSNIPLIVKSGSVSLTKKEPITVNNSYRAIIELENTYAGTRQAKFKLGRNSFEWIVTTQQNWEDNTLSHDNTAIVDGRLVLENSAVGWWDNNYSYRVPITLGTHPDAYQVRIVIDKVTDLDSGCLDNFQDLRFFENSDGDNILDFWIENYILGDNAIIWVERVENDLNQQDNVIYCYYGNASATENDNIRNTFIFGDEFFGENLDGISRWNTIDGTPTVENGILEIGVHEEEEIHSKSTYSAPLILEAYIRWNDSVSGADQGFLGFSGGEAVYPDGAFFTVYTPTTTYAAHYMSGGGNSAEAIPNVLPEYWEHHQIWRSGDQPGSVHDNFENFKVAENGVYDFQDDDVDSYPICIATYFGTSGEVEVDWVFLRTWAAENPSVSVGSVELASLEYASNGEWYSNNWELGIFTTIDNLVIEATTDLRGEWDLSANLSLPYGITYVVGGTPDWYILDADDDALDAYDNGADWFYEGQTGTFENTLGTGTGVTYVIDGITDMFLVCDSGSYEIDNYDTGTLYQNSFDVSGELTVMWDVEHLENDDTYYVGGGTSVYVYNSSGVFTGASHTLNLPESPTGFHHDGEYWYIVMGGTPDRIYQYDNNFNLIGCIRSIGADEGVVRDIYSDTTNIYAIGTGTDTAHMYSLDNTLDNIYAIIFTDTDNDNVMDDNTGWHFMDENGYWLNPENLNSGYNYQVAFRIESSDNTFTPRIGSYSLGVSYYMEWISVENWSDNFTVTEYEWVSAENWDDELIVPEEGVVTPLGDLDDVIINVFLPLFILFAPAISFAKKGGTMGFIMGLIIGTIIAYVAFGFSLGIVILIGTAIAILWFKGNT